MKNDRAPAAAANTGDRRLAHDTVEFGRNVVLDLELTSDGSTLTVYERGAARLKRSMTFADVERLLDQLPTSPRLWRP